MTPAQISRALDAVDAHARLASPSPHTIGGCRASSSRRRARIPVVLAPGRVALAHKVLRSVVPDPRLAVGWPTDARGVPLLPRTSEPCCADCARIVGRP